MKYCYALLFCLYLCATLGAQGIAPPSALTPKHASRSPVDFQQVLNTIAFGSCNNQNLDQTMWKAILQNQPNLWIWLGDNIYADTDNMKSMSKMYRKVLHEPDYQQLCKQSSVIGIWDDHDYGVNDGGKHYPKRKESRDLLFNFLAVPLENPARKREGAYQAYTIGPVGRQVKVILLDGRYFRDDLQATPNGTPRYFINETGDMLGEAQWKWLEEELRSSTAQLHLIGCGIQFINEEQGYEKWANFPIARQRLFDLLAKVKPAKTILISGDRHISEVSRIDLPGLGYPLYDFTSSGLTHSSSASFTESNRYRVTQMVKQRSFGIMRINWSATVPEISMEARGLNDLEYFKIKF